MPKHTEILLGKLRWVRGTAIHLVVSVIGDLVDDGPIHKPSNEDVDAMMEELMQL